MNKYIKDSLGQIKSTLEDRGNSYTKDDKSAFQVFIDTATITGMSVDDVFYTMIAMKMARLGQNITHADSIIDIAGYAILWDAYRRQLNGT